MDGQRQGKHGAPDRPKIYLNLLKRRKENPPKIYLNLFELLDQKQANEILAAGIAVMDRYRWTGLGVGALAIGAHWANQAFEGLPLGTSTADTAGQIVGALFGGWLIGDIVSRVAAWRRAD